MGVYIKGMEMPEDCAMLLKIFPDGRVGVPVHRNWMGTMVVKDAEAVPVQPHGRLIDADALWVEINKICDRRDAGIITDLTCVQQILSALRHAPTSIPFEDEEE